VSAAGTQMHLVRALTAAATAGDLDMAEEVLRLLRIARDGWEAADNDDTDLPLQVRVVESPAPQPADAKASAKERAAERARAYRQRHAAKRDGVTVERDGERDGVTPKRDADRDGERDGVTASVTASRPLSDSPDLYSSPSVGSFSSDSALLGSSERRSDLEERARESVTRGVTEPRDAERDGARDGERHTERDATSVTARVTVGVTETPAALTLTPSPKPKASRGTRVPVSAATSAEVDQWLAREGIDAAGRGDVLAGFLDYWRGVAGAKGCKADWGATWRNWVRRQGEFGGGQRATLPSNYVQPSRFAKSVQPTELVPSFVDARPPPSDEEMDAQWRAALAAKAAKERAS
jgi:hypothetical protein